MNALLLDRPLRSDALKPYLSRDDLEPQHGMYQAGHGASSRARVAPSPHSPARNHLLAALPAAEFERLSPHLELVPMPLDEMLYQPGRGLQHAYFPTTAIVSLHHVMQSGESSESASVANEGMVGIEVFMGADATASSAVVQSAGHGYRLAAPLLKEEFNRGGFLQRMLLRYTQALIAQTALNVACNRHHHLEQKLSRRLLSTLDRGYSREVDLTQELAARLLGVRRESITGVAGRLQRAGVICYHRGRIEVLDRSALESRACECYAAVRTELRRLLSDVRRQAGIPAGACTARLL